MKIVVDAKILKSALKSIGPATTSRTTLPILSCVNIIANPSGLTMQGTNLEIGVSLFVEGEVVEPGSIAIPFSPLSEIVSRVADGDIVITEKGLEATVTIGKQRAKLKGFSSDLFPGVQASGSPVSSFSVPALTLRKLINRVIFSASQDKSRPVLQCVYLRVKDNLIISCANDGYRVAECKEPCEYAGIPSSTLIMSSSAKALMELLTDDTMATLELYEGRLLVRIGEDALFTSAVVAGNYPNYEVILPQDAQAKIQVETATLKEIVAMAKVYISPDSKGKMTFEFDGEFFFARSVHPEMGEYFSGQIPCTTVGQPTTITLSIPYLSDILGAVTSKEVDFWLNPKHISAVFEAGNQNWIGAPTPRKTPQKRR